MAWPQSQDYNEAIQNPQSSFGDPELRGGQAVTNALGMPMPRSGNFADVYEFHGASGQKWAIKCFTRQIPGLQERYGVISQHLLQAKLPFMVDFSYLEKGIRIRGECYPVLKMQWVEGFLLNEFVRDNVDKPPLLDAMGQVWFRMAYRLRDAGIAHADLQHGNVILVPGIKASSLSVRLIDYDGMWVPALAQKKSGELGHPAYQHPQRLQQGTYSAEVDRLPLLGIACALRCLAVGGKPLWDKYDNGDNMLFRESDLRNPAASGLFKELWQINDPAAHDLTGYLAIALSSGLGQVPLLTEVINGNQVQPLSGSQEKQIAGLLGPGAVVNRSPSKAKTKVNMVTPVPSKTSAAAGAAAPDWDFSNDGKPPSRTIRKSARGNFAKVWLGMAVVIGLIAIAGVLKFLPPKKDDTITPKNAMIVLENLPPGATVLVDDIAMDLKAAEGKPPEIPIAPEKKHLLKVKKEGFKGFVEEVELGPGARKNILVRMERIEPAPPPKDATIVLENLPPDATVLVDDIVRNPKAPEGKPPEIPIAPQKKYLLKVKKEGFKDFVEEVELGAGARKNILVRMERIEPAPPPKDATIVLKDLPSDAAVLVDEKVMKLKALEGTPLEIPIAPEKKHRLEVKKVGFKDFVKEVELGAGGREVILVSMEPKDAMIVLENLPAGASLLVDGIVKDLKADSKPLEISIVPEKEHRLKVKKAGFKDFVKEVKLGAGGREVVLVRMKKIITEDMVKEKFKGKATYDDSNFLLIINYNFALDAARDQLEDFEGDKAKTEYRKVKTALRDDYMLILPASLNLKHKVKFTNVNVEGQVKALDLKGPYIAGMMVGTPGGTMVSFEKGQIFLDSGPFHKESKVPPQDRDKENNFHLTIRPTSHVQISFGTAKKLEWKFENQAVPVLGASTVGLMASSLGQGPFLATSALIPGRVKQAGFVEFFGGDKGFGYSRLSISGIIDEDWAQTFFAPPTNKNAAVVK